MEKDGDFSALGDHLSRVMSAFGIANNRLARYMGFDPSYISRTLAGQRRAADPRAFADDVAAYIARNHFNEAGKAKAAVLSKSTDDIILYSDMPLEEMAADEEFPKKVMMGIAALIRKGVRLANIHDVHRPFAELVMGLEGWLPLYMTGQVSPYYLPEPTNQAFLHFIRSAGTVAVLGEAISGNQGGGRYVVTKSAADVAYARRRATELLAHAKPLMRIFREAEAGDLARALRQLEPKAGESPVETGGETFKNMKITVWPGSHALVEKANPPKTAFLIEYPDLVDALERYEARLF